MSAHGTMQQQLLRPVGITMAHVCANLPCTYPFPLRQINREHP